MHIVYITLEYCAPDLFSGNGVCARSQVRRLAENAKVHVICGRPRNATEPEPEAHNITVIAIPLEVWFTTDRNSSHEAFAKGAARVLDKLNWASVEACHAVDWTGMNAVHAMSPSSNARMQKESVPVMYLSFRCYMSMTGISDEDRQFYKLAEGDAVSHAVRSGGGVVALCDDDWHTLRPFADEACAIRVIHPMLRAEFSTIAMQDKGKILDFGRRRLYLVSLVRLSEDKGAHRFVQLVQDIQRGDAAFWERTGVVPLLCGAASQPEYGDRVKRELRESVPGAVVVDRFLEPLEMAEVLQNAVLNVHGALYEAYGLTIVEAGAMGCPSVINESGIGAAQLLRPADGAVEVVDVTDRAMFVGCVKRVLEDEAYRVGLAHQAYLKATSWGEREYVAALEEFTRERVTACRNMKRESCNVP